MSSPINKVQKAKTNRVPKRGIAELLVGSMASSRNAPITPAITTDTSDTASSSSSSSSSLFPTRDTSGAAASTDPADNMDVDVEFHEDISMVDIDSDVLILPREEEIRLDELDHEKFLNGGYSDPDSDNEGVLEELPEFNDFATDNSTDIEENLEVVSVHYTNQEGPIIKNVVIPDYPFTQNDLDSIQFNYICINNNMTVQAVANIKSFVEMLVNRNKSQLSPKKRVPALKECMAMIRRKIPLDFVRTHEVCSAKGCYLFDSVEDVTLTACPECGAARSAKSVVKMVDIGDHLSKMLACDGFRSEVEQYRDVIDAMTEDDPYTDFFSGAAYKELREKGLFENKQDLAIVLCVDGFTSKVSRQSMVMVHVIIPSIDPSIRYTDEYTFQVAIFYGDTKTNFSSYLRPIISSLDTLSTNPIVVKKNGVHVATSKVFNLGVIADGVEINQRLLMFGGHTSTYGCRFCLVKGERPIDGGKLGKYFIDRTSSIRSKSLLLLEEDIPAEFNNYAIKSPTPFGRLNTFLSIDFFMCDELHMFSNVSKLCFDILSPRYNDRYKFAGREDKYPFCLSSAEFIKIKRSMDDSRCNIPSDFNGSFQGIVSENARSMYRSVDWIAWLVYVVPTLIASIFGSRNTAGRSTASALISLSRGVKLSLQWSINKDDLKEIEKSFDDWFKYLDSCLVSQTISRTILKYNMHQLHHIPYMIKRMGPLRCYSARSLERSIGAYKKRIRSTMHPGVNAGNIMETREIFKFFQLSKIFDFSALTAVANNPNNYMSHPNNDPNSPQLWSPFHVSDAGSLVVLNLVRKLTLDKTSCIKGDIRTLPWLKALMDCLSRMVGSKQVNIPNCFLRQEVIISAKLFFDNQVYISSMSKEKNKSSSRGGEYVMFTAVHKNSRFSSVSNWYVCKVLFFFRFQMFEERQGSHYVYGELMRTHGVSPYSKSVPRVQPFNGTDKKFVVFDAEDIVSVVGLLKETGDESTFQYVLRTGDAFEKDMSATAGQVKNIVLT